MEFLADYGLFLAKTLTLVIAIIAVVSFIVAAGMKPGGGEEKGQISVKKINDRFQAMADAIRDLILDEKTLKQEAKLRKKADKVQKKQAQKTEKKRVFLLDFDGDIKASQTEQLRQCVTAVLNVANQNDEVIVRLESSGGMVHSYGLASSQLARITQKSIPLTVCVDKVAASGGYMMACVADKILCAPFAIIGSIGVVAQLPNFHKVLKKNDVDFELLTAGKYKRTLTMLGENTQEGRDKFLEDLEDTHVLFKDFIKTHRGSVNIDEVATGEIWFGTRALEQQLVDAISTSDEYLLDLHPDSDIYQVSYELKKKLVEKLGVQVSSGIQNGIANAFDALNRKIFMS